MHAAHLFTLAIPLAGCATPTATFRVERAPDFGASQTAVSVVGLFRDGQMSIKGWEEISGPISSALGGGPCEAGYGERLQATDPSLFESAVVYSVSKGEVTARLHMRYTGTDFDDALRKFSEKLRSVVPATCVGWK